MSAARAEHVSADPSPQPLTRRLLVTGGTGYLGQELVRVAAKVGWDVEAGRVEIRDADAVGSLLRGFAPDVVIHTAYRQDGPEAWSTNVDGSEVVARAARAAAARLVHFSTDVVFDGRKGAPYVEEDPASPITDYGRSKAEAERRVARANPAALIVRTSMIYGGPGARPSKHELAALDPGNTFFTDEIRCPIQVGDLVAALLELVDLDVSGPLHVAGPDAVSRAEFAELASGCPVRTAPAPASRPLACALDSSLAQSLLRTTLRGVRTVLA
jgi:dTDP-4-dehydrorhamnose reductase